VAGCAKEGEQCGLAFVVVWLVFSWDHCIKCTRLEVGCFQPQSVQRTAQASRNVGFDSGQMVVALSKMSGYAFAKRW
jgi:hypothetical protein